MGKPFVKPRSGQWISQQENFEVKSVVPDAAPTTFDTAALDAQIALLQAQVTTLNSQITALNSQIAALQAQAAQDAATIASLQGQVTALTAQVASLNSQITALQNQLAAYTKFGTYFYGAVTLHTTGGIFIPPVFNDTTINVSVLNSPLIWGPVTRTGGGYP